MVNVITPVHVLLFLVKEAYTCERLARAYCMVVEAHLSRLNDLRMKSNWPLSDRECNTVSVSKPISIFIRTCKSLMYPSVYCMLNIIYVV